MIGLRGSRAGRPTALQARLLHQWLLTVILTALVVIALALTGASARLDNLIYDSAIRFTGAPPDPDIAIIAIDEASVQDIGRWPWPRTVHADLLERLNRAGARAVTLDILLTEAGDPANDQRLAQVAAASATLLLPMQLIYPGLDGRAFDVMPPYPAIGDTLDPSRTGHVNVELDADGVLRRLALCESDGANKGEDAPIPHIAISMAIAGKAVLPPSASLTAKRNCEDRPLVPFRGRDEFIVMSYKDVLSGQIDDQFLRGKWVLIGATAAGLGDQYPAGGGSGPQPGVIAVASLLDTVLHDRFIVPVEGGMLAAISLLPLFAFMVGVWWWKPQTVVRVVTLLGLLTLFIAIALLAAGYWLAPGPALAGLAIAYPLWGWRRLQATSDFLGQELMTVESEIDSLPGIERGGFRNDLVGEQSSRLALAIGRLSDLRRFVTNSMQGLPDPMLVADKGRTIRLANEAARRLFPAEPVGSDLVEFMLFLARDADRPALAEWIDHAYASPALAADLLQFQSMEGQSFVVRATSLAIADLADAAAPQSGIIIYLADITELAEAQKERDSVYQLLSHDMRAPQSSILALVERPDPRIQPPELRSRIAALARRTLQLADNFVDMARMRSTIFAPEDLLLADLVIEAADGLHPLASRRNIRIDVQDESNAGFVLGEGQSLYRAITNVIDNAIRYSPDNGTITIQITRAVSVNPAHDHDLLVDICDSGPGIDPDMLERLFERFATSAASGPVGRGGGIGLGLNYVATVMQRHEGSASAANNPKGGSCFTLRLPMLPDEDLPLG